MEFFRTLFRPKPLEIVPCRFCGGGPQPRHEYGLEYLLCGCRDSGGGAWQIYGESWKEAIRNWNELNRLPRGQKGDKR